MQRYGAKAGIAAEAGNASTGISAKAEEADKRL
jgi:hypothetical protein